MFKSGLLCFAIAVVKMVSLGRAVFWWETARFFASEEVFFVSAQDFKVNCPL
jgi:hypothetical protein